MAKKRSPGRKFQIVLTGTLPKGMTVAQARKAYWNSGFDGDVGANYTGRAVDVDDFFDDGRTRRPMTVWLGRASLVKR